jgi:4,5-DOPA dioxygenase extradiol
MARMPACFVAHGAPLVAIEPARGAPLTAWAAALPRPRAILIFSAHWEAPLAVGQTRQHDALVYDFGAGLPRALFAQTWPAPGAPGLADRVEALLGPRTVARADRGLDHGAWTVLLRMFPDADLPTLQVSLPRGASEAELIDLGRALAPLRDEGVLLIGSGNLVHNLRALDPTERRPPEPWAVAFDAWIAEQVERGDLDALADWRARAPSPDLAHPTDEHLRPLFVILGAGAGGRPSWPLVGFEHGSTSRRCLQLD